MSGRAPIVNTGIALGLRAIDGCEITLEAYHQLEVEAERRGMGVGTLTRHAMTALARNPELIATVLLAEEFRALKAGEAQ